MSNLIFYDVNIEPHLQQLQGECLEKLITTRDDEAD